MIKELKLESWKSFKAARLYVDPLTFIIGTNAAGKSNVVDALSFISRIPTGLRLTEFADIIRGGIDGLIYRGDKVATLTIIVEAQSDEYEYSISFVKEGKELLVEGESLAFVDNKQRKTILYNTGQVDKQSNHIAALFQKDKPGPRKSLPVRRDMPILAQVSNLNVIKSLKERVERVSNVFRSIFVLDPKPAAMRTYTALSDTLLNDGSNIAGFIAGMIPDDKKHFEELLTGYVKALPDRDLKRVWSEPVGLFASDAMLYCTEEWVDGQSMDFDARAMSDGTLRFVAIVATLLSAQKGSTIVIEEIDNGLHPSRAGELVQMLDMVGAERQIDVICTTHNPILIDALGPEMIPCISYIARSPKSGGSEIMLLEDAPNLMKLLANYRPGDLMTKGMLKYTQE